MITLARLEERAIEHQQVSRVKSTWLPLLSVWLLMVITFSAPGREGPESVAGLDLIAVAKVAARAAVVALLGAALLIHRHHPRRHVVVWCFFPWALYVAFAIASVLWSPLRSVTLGQAAGLFALVMLSGACAMTWAGPRDTSRVLFHLSVCLLVISTIVLAVDLVDHSSSGLQREGYGELEGAAGIVHPTSAGATAALGIVILIASLLLWDWRWSRVLLLPGLAVHLPLLVLAQSRMAVILTFAVVSLAVLLLMNLRAVFAWGLASCLVLFVYLVLDPAMLLVDSSLDLSALYLQRGESVEQLASLTGRTELWAKIYESYLESPWWGHGYFVSSADGALDVWSGPANRTAHNVVLQVLVSTGLIGMALFTWALWRPASRFVRTLASDAHRSLAWFAAILALWYGGWSMLCASFMGPVRPESVVFFAVLGLVVGQAARGLGRTERLSDLEDKRLDARLHDWRTRTSHQESRRATTPPAG